MSTQTVRQHALTKRRQKTNAQRPQTTQEEQCMTLQVQLTEAIVLASQASEKNNRISH